MEPGRRSGHRGSTLTRLRGPSHVPDAGRARVRACAGNRPPRRQAGEHPGHRDGGAAQRDDPRLRDGGHRGSDGALGESPDVAWPAHGRRGGTVQERPSRAPRASRDPLARRGGRAARRLEEAARAQRVAGGQTRPRRHRRLGVEPPRSGEATRGQSAAGARLRRDVARRVVRSDCGRAPPEPVRSATQRFVATPSGDARWRAGGIRHPGSGRGSSPSPLLATRTSPVARSCSWRSRSSCAAVRCWRSAR